MSMPDGSHLHLQSPVSHGPQILRPAPNRHFPLPSSAFDSRLLSNLHHRSSPPPPATHTPKIPLPQSPSPLKPTIKSEDGNVQNILAATDVGHKEEMRTHIPPQPLLGTDVKQQRVRKLKHKRLMSQASGSIQGIPNALASNNCRYDSSLSLLTKKFVDLLQKTQDGTIDLNKAAEILDVQKRRIYDITNVLEGVGLMEKSLKNRIRWKGNDLLGPVELESQVADLKVANETLFKEECRIDGMIREMEEKVRVMTEESDKIRFLHLTKEDINSLPCFQNSTLIAIKAPHGTSIEVPDPDEGLDFPQRRYQMFLRSSIGPINCFLISNHEEQLEAANQDQQLVPMDLDNECDDGNDGSCTHPSEQDTAETSSSGQDEVVQSIYAVTSISKKNIGGLVKIIPEDDVDADYWFELDKKGSLTDMWSE